MDRLAFCADLPYCELCEMNVAWVAGLHRTAPGVMQRLVDCSGGDEINEDSGIQRKADTLLRLLREGPNARTMVFCNKIETCRKVSPLVSSPSSAT